MVAAVVAEISRIDPALEFHRQRRLFRCWNHHLRLHRAIFRPARRLHRELARRQQHRAAIRTIQMLLEKEIRRQTPRLRWEDMPLRVGEGQPRRRRLAIEVLDIKLHCDRRSHLKQHRHLRTKTQILRPLPDVERERHLAFPRFARIDERDSVFDLESAQVRRHRRRLKHADLQKAVLAFRVLVLAQMRLPLALHRALRHTRIRRSGLSATDTQFGHARGVIDHFHQHRRIACLLHLRCRRTALRLHA